MMAKMGYTAGSGLGHNEQGMTSALQFRGGAAPAAAWSFGATAQASSSAAAPVAGGAAFSFGGGAKPASSSGGAFVQTGEHRRREMRERERERG